MVSSEPRWWSCRITGSTSWELAKEAGLEDVTTYVPTNEVELLREPDKKESAAEEVDEIEGKAPDNLLRDTATQEDVTADDAAGHNLRELAKEAGLEDGTTNVPRRRSQRLK